MSGKRYEARQLRDVENSVCPVFKYKELPAQPFTATASSMIFTNDEVVVICPTEDVHYRMDGGTATTSSPFLARGIPFPLRVDAGDTISVIAHSASGSLTIAAAVPG